MNSRHLTAARELLLGGLGAVVLLATLAALGVEPPALDAVAGVVSTLILTVGGVGGVSAGRHLGEGLRRPPPTQGA